MPHLTVSARAPAVVEARPLNDSVVIKVGDSLLSLDRADAHQLGEDLADALSASAPESISGPVTASADHGNNSVVISLGAQALLNLSVAAWTSLSMQGSHAALQLQRKGLRVGLRSPMLQLGNADLVEVQA